MRRVSIAKILISLLVLISLSGAKALEITGDTWITTETWWNETNCPVTVSGHVYVSHGGILHIDNCEVYFNNSYDNQYNLTVEANGILYINDSFIGTTGLNDSAFYRIWLRLNATYSDERPVIKAKNSTFDHIGSWGPKFADTGGGLAFDDASLNPYDNIIENCIFQNFTAAAISEGDNTGTTKNYFVIVRNTIFKDFRTDIPDGLADCCVYMFSGSRIYPLPPEGYEYYDNITFKDLLVNYYKVSEVLGASYAYGYVFQNVKILNVTPAQGASCYGLSHSSASRGLAFANIYIKSNQARVAGPTFNPYAQDHFIYNVFSDSVDAENASNECFHTERYGKNITTMMLKAKNTRAIQLPGSTTGEYTETIRNWFAEDVYTYDFIGSRQVEISANYSTLRNFYIRGGNLTDPIPPYDGMVLNEGHPATPHPNSYNIFENFTFEGNYTANPSGPDLGSYIRLVYSQNNVFRDFKFNGNANYLIHFYGNLGNKNNKFINFNNVTPSAIKFDNNNDTFVPYFYADIKVVDENGNPVSNAIVNITNEVDSAYQPINRKGEVKTEFITGSDGHIPKPIKPNPIERWSDYFAMEPNTEYEFGAWVKTVANGSFTHAIVLLEEYDSNYNIVADRVLPVFAETDWIERNYTFTSTPETAYGRVMLYAYSKGGCAYFDDIYLYKKGTTTNLVPNPSFEDGETSPYNWSATDDYIGFWDSVAHSGTKSYRINWTFDWINDEDTACLADFILTNTSYEEFVYKINISDENGVRLVVPSALNPNATWYREDPSVPNTTITFKVYPIWVNSLGEINELQVLEWSDPIKVILNVTGASSATFNISTNLPNQKFNIYRNGTLYDTATTDANGWLNWTYDGGFSTWVFTFQPAEEEEEDWITVTPTSISVEVAKGSTKTESIKIKNNMDFPITVTLGLSGINEDEVYVTYPKQVYLNYYQTKEVRIKFRGLKEGTYEGALFVCANGCYRIPVTVKVTKYIPPIVIPTPKPAIPGFEAVAAVVAVTAVVALRMGRLKVRRRS